MPAKKPISLRPQAVKTAIHLQSTKIDKNPFVTQRVFLHTLFLECATETGGNKCKAVFYTYEQIGMWSLELFWPDLKAPLGPASKVLRACWMAWCKRDVSDLFRWNFFSFKSAWIFACAFQLSSTTFPCIFFFCLVCTLFLRKTKTKYSSVHNDTTKQKKSISTRKTMQENVFLFN